MAGPMPGSTPTAVPSSTPITAYSRFIGVAASAKPWSSQLKLSIYRIPSKMPAGSGIPSPE